MYERYRARACTGVLPAGGCVPRSADSSPATRSRATAARPRRRIQQKPEGSFLDFVEGFHRRFPKAVDEYETLLTDNRIWKQSTVGIGVISRKRP